jgi:hypothetical protein
VEEVRGTYPTRAGRDNIGQSEKPRLGEKRLSFLAVVAAVLVAARGSSVCMRLHVRVQGKDKTVLC